MNFKTTIALALILGLLVGIYFFAFRDKSTTDAQKKDTIGTAYGIEKSAVMKICLEFKDKSFVPFTLIRDDDGRRDSPASWRFSEPIHDGIRPLPKADAKKIEQLLTKLIERKIKRRIAKPDDLTKYGLDEPQIRYTVWTNDKSREFLIGNKGISFSVYAKEATEDSVITIEHTVLEYLSKTPADLRAHTIFDFQLDKVTQIALNYPARSIVCERRPEKGEWQIIKPIQTKADRNAIDKFLGRLGELKVDFFEKVEKFNVTFELVVSIENAQTVLQLGDKIPKTNRVYAQLKDELSFFSIRADAAAELTKTLYDLRDKQVLDFQRTDVTKFVIERPDVKIVCERDQKDEWSIVEPINVKADKDLIEYFLFRLDALEAKKFLGNPADLKNLRKYGLKSPSINVTLLEKSGVFVLQIGAQKDDILYVIADSPQSDQAFLVANDILEIVGKNPSDFRDKRITDFYSGDVVELRLDYDDKLIVCKKYGNDWRIATPVNVDADDIKVNSMLYILNKIRAKKFVPEHRSLTDPQLLAVVKLNDDTVYTLLIGATADENSAYAKMKEFEGAFTVARAIVEKLKRSVDELGEKGN